MASANHFHHYYSRFAVVVVICCAALPSICQSGATYSIEAKAVYDGSNLILRWAPKDFATWNWANFNDGYDVERTTIKQNGTPLSSDSMLSSRVTLAVSLKPLPEMQWETMPDTNLAGIVAGSIYGDSIEVVDLANADFMTVVNTNEARQNRFGFSLFACDQNFDIALAAGLAFVDTTVLGNFEYIYIVKLHTLPGGTTQKKGAVIITTIAQNMDAPAKPGVQSADKAVLLSWPKQADYGSYVLERSANNGLTYTTLNNTPFVSLSKIDGGQQSNTYLDSLAANNIPYVYRVRGLTPFGMTGPPSDTVHAAGTPTPIAVAPHISAVAELQPGQMRIVWTFPQSMESVISQFEVHRSPTIDGKYELVATAQPNVRMLTDNSPLSANYYLIKAKDLQGNYAISLPKLGQTKDEAAPAPPTGLSGTCDASGLVTIKWSPNAEGDLKGYRVYTSDQNVVDSAFAQITSKPILDTFFRYQVGLNSLTEQLFFAVKAADLRENTSASSAYLNIQRADAVAPSAPAITKVIPRTEAVQLKVSLSSSNDVVRYEFQKRWEGSPDWVTLAVFPTANMVTSYADSLTYLDPVLRRRWYFYRLVAFDDANLPSSSQMIRTKPLDQGIRGAIQNLTATLLPDNPKRVQLQWNYPKDVDLVGFQIYRAIDNSQMRSFKFVDASYSAGPDTHTYLDTDTDLKNTPQKSVFIQPATVPGGGTTTITAAVVNKPISTTQSAFITLKYQVMAVFMDGAQSPLSSTVQVTFQ